MECLVCNRKTDGFHDDKLGIDVYRCRNCGCIFKNPETFRSMEAQKARYDLHENDPDSDGYRAYFQRFLDFVLPKVGKPATALDFGCGRSRLLADILTQHGIACDAYDPIYRPDISYNTKKYDLIVSVEVFEHLHDPAAEFRKLIELLNSSGFLAIQTEFALGSIEEYLQWYYRLDPTHVVFYSPKTFKKLCGSSCDYIADNGKNIAVIQKQIA